MVGPLGAYDISDLIPVRIPVIAKITMIPVPSYSAFKLTVNLKSSTANLAKLESSTVNLESSTGILGHSGAFYNKTPNENAVN